MRYTVQFDHGVFSDSYEKQANKQGYTFGDEAEYVENVGFGLVIAYMDECITDDEFDRILDRFEKKVLMERLKPISEKKEK